MVILTKKTGTPVLLFRSMRTRRFSERLKNDADMDVLRCAVVERIEKRNDALVTRERRVGFLDGMDKFCLIPAAYLLADLTTLRAECWLVLGTMSVGIRGTTARLQKPPGYR
jgi:hypothetical protein